jgi:hypothetical protein
MKKSHSYFAASAYLLILSNSLNVYEICYAVILLEAYPFIMLVSFFIIQWTT